MEVLGLKSDLLASGADLLAALKKSLLKVNRTPGEGDIVVFSSKVVALAEGRSLSPQNVDGRPDHRKKSLDLNGEEDENLAFLIEQEADTVLPGPVYLTLKNGIFVANAGIDRSNSPLGTVLPWPRYPYDSAENLRLAISKNYGLKCLGVIITDSVCLPLRAGTVGMAIGYSGFKGVADRRGEQDLFGKELKVSRVNAADALAAAANLLMGEAAESCPFALIRDSGVEFTARPVSRREICLDPDQCLFAGLYPKEMK